MRKKRGICANAVPLSALRPAWTPTWTRSVNYMKAEPLSERTLEALKEVTKPAPPEEREQWWQEASQAYFRTKKMFEIGFAPYDPQPERALRLISELTRLGPEYMEYKRALQGAGLPEEEEGS
jgi:hypothetical protein